MTIASSTTSPKWWPEAGKGPIPAGVPAALRAGVGLVPEDRHREGLIPLLSVLYLGNAIWLGLPASTG